jgi:hypothetical protein
MHFHAKVDEYSSAVTIVETAKGLILGERVTSGKRTIRGRLFYSH